MRRVLPVLFAALFAAPSSAEIAAPGISADEVCGLSCFADCIAPSLACDSTACPTAQPVLAEANPSGLALGERMVEKYECGRCHDVARVGLTATPKARNCAGCHAWIAQSRYDGVERERGRERYERWDEYVENVDSFLNVPDLGAAARLDPKWVASYLRAPYRLRPAIGESMPRMPIGDAEAEAIAKWLAERRPMLTGVALEASKIPAKPFSAEGERLYAKNGCANCHAFGTRAASPGHRAAPDLSHARSRMTPADIAAYIADPMAFGGNPMMPSHGLSAREAALLRDFVLFAPVEKPASADTAKSLPLLTRKVRWQEVDARIFGAVCVHCHMDPEAEDGEGGPGNTGGLGYEGVGLDLSSWDGVVAGKILDGKLMERLRLRHAERTLENAGPHAVPANLPGMPLGLAPLSAEDMQLLESWIAQGAPGPDGTLAMKGRR